LVVRLRLSREFWRALLSAGLNYSHQRCSDNVDVPHENMAGNLRVYWQLLRINQDYPEPEMDVKLEHIRATLKGGRVQKILQYLWPADEEAVH